MHDESISQAEIDALVRGLTGGAKSSAPAAAAPAGNGDDKSQLRDLLKEYSSVAGQALSDLVGTHCHGGLLEVWEMACQSAGSSISGQFLIGQSALTSGLPGSVYFLMPLPLALNMITQIYGGVAPSALDDSALAALSDGITQMNQMGLTRFGEALGRPVFGGPVEVVQNSTLADVMGVAPGTPVTVATLDLTLGDDSGNVILVLPQAVTGALQQALKDRAAGKAAAPAQPAYAAVPQPAPSPAAQAPRQVVAQAAAAAAAPVAQQAYQAARFPEVQPQRPVREEIRNIDLLLDVSLQVTVELGRARRQIRDVLSLGPGSVLELDKLAGEQVDVLVNGKLIARGEVVVIDENYGVRITDIISPMERVQSLR
ncbi:MAG TPA: flagellar motor switch protein FliN [Symbiobacteriaceae bacterium]|nr:flagellar motor switch protein FliN [Symbiobacteriaceae bacterium]